MLRLIVQTKRKDKKRTQVNRDEKSEDEAEKESHKSCEDEAAEGQTATRTVTSPS